MKTRLLLVCVLAWPATPALADDSLALGVPPWDGARVKSAVVAEILEGLGYAVETVEASAPMVFRSMASGEVDINLSAWKPGQDQAFQPHVDAGDIEILGENLSGARTGLAVPRAAYEAGLRSKARLGEFADRLDSSIHCIEPGSGAVTVTREAIDADIYGLGDWNLVTSSTAAMLAEVGRSIDRDQWVVFCAWSPHWMNVRHEIRYLDDPENHWGNEGNGTRVFTLVRSGLADAHPAVAGFLSRFAVTSEVQSRWIEEHAYRDRAERAVAREWIRENPETVLGWVEGLRTRDGEPAQDALRRDLLR